MSPRPLDEPGPAAAVLSAGLVLAAGAGRRFGGTKQLAELGGRPLIEHALSALGALERVVVVLGARADEVRAGADLRGAELVVCTRWAEGMSASLRCGLDALAGAEEVVIALADQPFVTPAVVERVRSARGPAARAVYDGAPGHPVVIRRPLLDRAGELSGDAGFRDLLDGVAEVECADLADPRDIDTRDDLEVVRR
ncbi:MAG TPA: nucleotidyltransferase family protein [Solirubrobacteraceae bacterium]|nr:nucleotidyltransferase family protein [Solirubrobacteraceae bacterium]